MYLKGNKNEVLTERNSKKQIIGRYIRESTAIVIIALIASILIMNFLFFTARVDGRSMNPTLENNDRLVVEKVTFYLRSPKIDDVVVFKDPFNPAIKLIKRVAAVEGDKIRIENSRLVLNNKIVYEPYLLEYRMKDFPEVIVPKDMIFVLGDNRNNSKDSRDPAVGFISLRLISGRAAYRIFTLSKIERIK